MTILDANILIYAGNPAAPQHPAVVAWLDRLSRSGETIAIPWLAIWAFVRIVTNARYWLNPMTADEAFAFVREWMALPQVEIVGHGPRHLEVLSQLAVEHGITGPRTTDAVYAALAIEHDATLASADQDFARFPGLRWIDPVHA